MKSLAYYIEKGCNKLVSSEHGGIPLSTVYRWFKEPQFESLLNEAFSTLEKPLLEEALRRAMSGSDVLLIFLLRSVNPERYDDAVRKQRLDCQSYQPQYSFIDAPRIHAMIAKDPFKPKIIDT